MGAHKLAYSRGETGESSAPAHKPSALRGHCQGSESRDLAVGQNAWILRCDWEAAHNEILDRRQAQFPLEQVLTAVLLLKSLPVSLV